MKQQKWNAEISQLEIRPSFALAYYVDICKLWLMKLSEWLKATKTKKIEFAARIGVSPSMVTRLCDGSQMPNVETAHRVWAATGGAVTPNDFYGFVIIKAAS
ncbi:hypothetical protein ABIE64_003518 [Thalassospira sp. MBR-102]|jgi:3,4-dihydroxy 2-butanone 4-phosphate synthase/GTP cyclohydrolase II|uniref:helix-turn-helix transcriptional regulator n=1 Tax=Thalassospira sp. MBR-102 TaxID=3156466 RepID=UPI003397D2B2